MGRAWRRDLLALVIGSVVIALAVAGERVAFAAATIRVPADHATIQAAINAAQTGDVVIVSPGTYSEPLDIRSKSITLASEFFLTGDRAAIDATILEPPAGASGIAIQKSVLPQARIVGFTIRNTTGSGDGIKSFGPAEILDNRIVGFVDGIDFGPSTTGPATSIVIRGNLIENTIDDGIDFDGPVTAVVENNVLRANSEDGIEIRFHEFASRLDLVIRGNTITGSRQDGIQLIDEIGVSDRHLRIEGNVFSNINRAAIGLMDNAASSEDYRAASLLDEIFVFNNTFHGSNHAVSGGDNLVAVNNLFVNASTLALKGVDGNSIAAYNLFWGNGANSAASNVDAATTIVANPLLAADLTLQDGSPATDAGTATFDWQGRRVLDLAATSYSGAAPDLGARERAATAAGPETTITQAPPTFAATTSATFGFTSNATGATFECALDGAPFARCTSPVTYLGLAEGAHTFHVRATDQTGATDPTPASRSWTVDTVAPQTTIGSAPANPSTTSSASFTFSSSESASTFACSLDGAAFAACTSPKTYSGLANGSHTFAVRAGDAAGNVDASPATHTWSLTATSYVLAAAGDIGVCENGVPAATTQGTAALLDSIAPDAVLPLGDNAYEDGSSADYMCSYDPTWGRHFARTYPIPGNHEYHMPGAPGYFQYFGARAGDPAKGYYSHDVGNWHLVALNSECAAVGGCGAGSPQETWLRQDLAATATSCIAAYWHTAYFSSGNYRPGVDDTRALYQALYDRGVDVLLVGHDHNYERFARQTTAGALDLARGVRQFIVGTGGRSLYPQGPPIANSEARNASTHGVLKLVLRSDGYDWQFLPRAGQAFTDSGSDTCGGTPADTVAPASPTSLTATGLSSTVELAWAAPADNVGVIAHDVFRNGALVGSTTAANTFTDATVVAGVAYTYEVRARDAAGNVSGPSNTASATAGGANVRGFAPDADALVDQGRPDTNFGTSTALGTDLSPNNETFIRFAVSGVTGSVTSARLRLLAYGGSVDGPSIYSTGTSWSETAITWNTKPARIGSALGDKGAVATNTWVEYDVTAAVQGNGTYAFNLVPTSSDGADFYSREAAVGRRPELVLTLGGDITPPQTTILTGPSGAVAATSGTFTFSSSEAGSSFACALDGTAFAPCSSPATYSSLTEGPHTFAVRATDSAGNADATPATRSWTVDTSPPDTSIASGPSGLVNSGSASFGFGASEAGASFQCALDGAAPTACTSPRSYGGLADGSHTFTVTATDPAGNADASPASRTWTIDTVAPAAPVIVSPANGAALTSSTVTVSGSAEPGTAVELFDGAVSKALTSADAAGAWQVTLGNVADGPHSYTATASDPAGNRSSASAAVSITVDTGPPETTITAAPTGSVNTQSASFSFAASEPGASFACTLDGAAPSACTSPTNYGGLPDGSHTFTVTATDPAGNADPTPATRTWTIDTVAPGAPVIGSPADGAALTSATVTVTGTAEPGTSVELFDGPVSKALTSADAAGAWQVTLGNVGDGPHSYTATAGDPAGNRSNASAAVTVTVDTGPPETTITAGPTGSVNTQSASFSFAASEPGASFACTLDGAAPSACTSPINYGGLADGPHTFTVTATDPAGNTDPTPASRSWTIDTATPETTIDGGPNGTVNTGTATFTFSASETGSSFQCALDGASPAGCSSPRTYTGLADGVHTFAVQAIDPAGNIDASSATRTWTVNTTPPQILTFVAAADARVEQRNPATNYGAATTLISDLSPVTESYLRFTVTGVSGTVTSARLRLFITSSTPNAPALYAADNAWTETGITWNTRPARIGSVVDNRTSVTAKTWVEYDVHAVVAANGTYTFVLAPESTNGMTVKSRESSADRPQLVLAVSS